MLRAVTALSGGRGGLGHCRPRPPETRHSRGQATPVVCMGPEFALVSSIVGRVLICLLKDMVGDEGIVIGGNT